MRELIDTMTNQKTSQTYLIYLRVAFDTFTVRFTFTFSKCLFGCF